MMVFVSSNIDIKCTLGRCWGKGISRCKEHKWLQRVMVGASRCKGAWADPKFTVGNWVGWYYEGAPLYLLAFTHACSYILMPACSYPCLCTLIPACALVPTCIFVPAQIHLCPCTCLYPLACLHPTCVFVPAHTFMSIHSSSYQVKLSLLNLSEKLWYASRRHRLSCSQNLMFLS